MHPSVHAQLDPDKPACIMAASGEALSYGDLEARSNRLAHYLRSLGIAPGDTIAIILDNQPWLFIAAWAAQRSGLYYACLSYRLSGDDLGYILKDSGAKLAIGSRTTIDVLAGAVAAGYEGPLVLVDDHWGTTPALAELTAGFPATPIADEMAGTDMLYSSGTTGRPKGVRQPFVVDLPIDRPTPLLKLAQSRFGMGRDTVYLSPAPLYHAGPLRWSMLVQRLGGTVVVMEKFDAEGALALIDRHGVTAAQWVPTHFSRMLQLPDAVRGAYSLASLRVALHAAAPCPVPVKERMLAWWGPKIHEYYGGTENNGLTLIGPEEWAARPGSVGKAFVGTVKICDEKGAELPPGETGDVYFADGPRFEYHNDAAKTRSAYNDRGWSTLGDVGHLDADGYLFLTDRKNFTIISGGVNIYPQEIENALGEHPAVGDVAVFGAPDADLGERVVAVIEPKPGVEPSGTLAEDIGRFARDRLGSLKTPKQIDFTDALPREPTGKLFKKKLVEEYRQRAADAA
ncbi:acyl-CoA synthetase [Sphingopyxis sp.]|uniref:acyl-CoA synthetase n=1 Tax=Sphingopyxis sp. TaxID=1908224 RepID=UPI002D77D6FA|nr:acyl-CoA synthetase [Sphingopyxis sp.]HET6525135.1 acyl-CoA synthetase [Sphingopyxis sp.]